MFKHTISFDLHQTRWEFIVMGFKFIWAGIRNTGVVYFNDAGCNSIEADGVKVD